jgi:hypothetical protein
MTPLFIRTLGALALAGTCLATQAANVTLTGWAYGSGNTVQTSTPMGDYAGWAGGFGGSLGGTDAFNTGSFVTYCIELEEHFSFGSAAMTGYRLVESARYFQVRRGNADIAVQLGRLMTYAADHAALVNNAAGSTALQLAIWNLVYDTDFSVTASGTFRDSSAFMATATTLLAGAASVTASRYDVFALERSGSQDFLLVTPRDGANGVPEPGSLALVAAALTAAWGLARRRA